MAGSSGGVTCYGSQEHGRRMQDEWGDGRQWTAVAKAGLSPPSFINRFTGNISKGHTDKGQGHRAHRLVREMADGLTQTFTFNANAST